MKEEKSRLEYLLWKLEEQGLSYKERQELRELQDFDWREM